MTNSLSRRLAALEEAYARASEATRVSSSGGGGGAEGLGRKFISSFTHAMSHIRRREIDRQPWAYDVEKLRNDSPFSVAVYVAALRHWRHEDEAVASEILEQLLEARGVDPAPLERLIHLVDRLK